MRNINRKFYNENGKRLFFGYILRCMADNGKRYVGYSEDPETRWEAERTGSYRASTPKIYNSPLSRAIRKFGWESFTKEIILTSTNRSDALDAERFCIEQYKTYIRKYGVEYGYNQTPGGEAPPARSGEDHPNFGKRYGAYITDPKLPKEKITAEELSRRISEGLKRSPLNAVKDRSVSEATREKISTAAKGRKLSAEAIRAKILFSEEEEQVICQSYLNNTSIAQLMRKYGCSDVAIKNCMRRNNIPLTNDGRKKKLRP